MRHTTRLNIVIIGLGEHSNFLNPIQSAKKNHNILVLEEAGLKLEIHEEHWEFATE